MKFFTIIFLTIILSLPNVAQQRIVVTSKGDVLPFILDDNTNINIYQKGGKGNVAPAIYDSQLIYNYSNVCTENKYIGADSGDWEVDANWFLGHVPLPSEVAVIDSKTVNINIDSLFPSQDSICGLLIKAGGNLIFPSSAFNYMSIANDVNIDSGGILKAGQPGIIVYGSWINNGTFDTTISTIEFAGDDSKIISQTRFYNLTVNGANTTTSGTIGIMNTLLLNDSLGLRLQDTLIIESADTAIQGGGMIPSGTIKRKTSSLYVTYRFESPLTYIEYTEGTPPVWTEITTIPDTLADTTKVFRRLTSTRDTSVNWVRTTSYYTFDTTSTWGLSAMPDDNKKEIKSTRKARIGLPKQNLRVESVPSDKGEARVNRMYLIRATTDDMSRATLQLRYKQDEVRAQTDENSLEILDGYISESNVKKGWNMISVSLKVDKTLKDSLFKTSNSLAYSFDSGFGYVAKESLKVGVGYWLKFPYATNISMLGDVRISDTMKLHSGWNMIGTLSIPISTDSIEKLPGSIVLTPFYSYDEGYFPTEVLQPMKAYWVKSSISGKLVLKKSITPLTHRTNTVREDALNFNYLTLTDSDGKTKKLFFSFPNDNVKETDYELPPLPPNGVFDIRYSTNTWLVCAETSESREIGVKLHSVKYPITISWDVHQHSGAASLRVAEKQIILSGTSSIMLNDEKESIKLLLASSISAGIPSTFALYQNYPNPFNSSTVIRYQLPVHTHVSLNVYNLLGQHVVTLVDEVQDVGYKTVSWNGSGSASGVYYYKLKTGNFIEVKKMIFIR
ncbi:MAG: T9SS type A sorting domain-containing protein [Ignavibacteriae bacterium]|nr:T9SS type A sorting domain-containing protein [Ignavibacteriota bacterium]